MDSVLSKFLTAGFGAQRVLTPVWVRINSV